MKKKGQIYIIIIIIMVFSRKIIIFGQIIKKTSSKVFKKTIKNKL